MTNAAVTCSRAVDRAMALAAAPRPRRTRFASAHGAVVLQALRKRAATAILPRRLTLTTAEGESLTLLLRRRNVVAVVEVAPSGLWGGDTLPAATEDDEEGALVTHLAADAIAALLDRAAEVTIRIGFAEAGDDTTGDGVPMAMLLDALAERLPDGGLPADRATLLNRFHDSLDGMPRAILAGRFRQSLPDGTPPHIGRLFATIGPELVRHKPGDPPEVLLFEQGTNGGALTVVVADEDRMCLAHAATPAEAATLLGAVRKLKHALDLAATADDDATVH